MLRNIRTRRAQTPPALSGGCRMLSHNDLLDLYRVFINIRQYPDAPVNEPILAALLATLRQNAAGITVCDNRFRHAIRELELLLPGHWNCLICANAYAYTYLIRDPQVLNVLETALACMLSYAMEEEWEALRDLADTMHNFPAMVCENHYKIPKGFFAHEVKWFREKHASDFLR